MDERDTGGEEQKAREQADRMEDRAERMERRSDELEEDVEGARREWESKKDDPTVPGAQDEQGELDEDEEGG